LRWKTPPVLSLPNQTRTNPAQTGTVASSKGVFLRVWPQRPGDWTFCNNTGGVLVEMPTIPPGKTKT
jgi:hypothetical protein